MKSKNTVFLTVLVCLALGSWSNIDNKWIKEKHEKFTVFYKPADKLNLAEYDKYFENGVKKVCGFFDTCYRSRFDIYVQPGRHSLDSTWEADWNDPNFKSECWMVGSGVAKRLDIISPKKWDTESCEHKFAETEKTEQLITHEMVHVFHGQRNVSPDFNNTVGIDWFVEGLATYASGQYDSLRMADVKKAISEKSAPESLDNFWTGKLRYWQSASIVMFIDQKYGRATLTKLLQFNNKTDILSVLKINESELINEWKESMLKL